MAHNLRYREVEVSMVVDNWENMGVDKVEVQVE